MDVTEAYIRWQHRETGQWYVTQTDHNRRPLAPAVITRPIYPDAPPVRLSTARQDAEDAAAAVVPPPDLPSTPVALDASWMPQIARQAIKRAQENAWVARAYKAIGPRIDARGRVGEERSATLGLRFDRALCGDPERVVMTWRWAKVTRTSNGVKTQVPGWVFDGAWIMPGRLLITSPEALRALSLGEFPSVLELATSRLATAS